MARVTDEAFALEEELCTRPLTSVEWRALCAAATGGSNVPAACALLHNPEVRLAEEQGRELGALILQHGAAGVASALCLPPHVLASLRPAFQAGYSQRNPTARVLVSRARARPDTLEPGIRDIFLHAARHGAQDIITDMLCTFAPLGGWLRAEVGAWEQLRQGGVSAETVAAIAAHIVGGDPSSDVTTALQAWLVGAVAANDDVQQQHCAKVLAFLWLCARRAPAVVAARAAWLAPTALAPALHLLAALTTLRAHEELAEAEAALGLS